MHILPQLKKNTCLFPPSEPFLMHFPPPRTPFSSPFPICPNIIHSEGLSSPAQEASLTLTPPGLPTTESCCNSQPRLPHLRWCVSSKSRAVSPPPLGSPHPPQVSTFMLATANAFFSRYFPSFWGYVYRSTSLIWGEGNPIRRVLAPESCAGCVLEHH